MSKKYKPQVFVYVMGRDITSPSIDVLTHHSKMDLADNIKISLLLIIQVSAWVKIHHISRHNKQNISIPHHLNWLVFIEGFVPNKAVSIFSFGGARGPVEFRAPTIPKPRRRPAPFAVSMATSSNDVSIPRGGRGSRGGASPPAAPTPLHPCLRTRPLAHAKWRM